MGDFPVPHLLFGYVHGARYAEGKSPTKKQLWVWSVVGVVAMALVPYFFLYQKWTLWYYGMFWNLFFFSTPACMFGVTKLLEPPEGKRPGPGAQPAVGIPGGAVL